MLYWKRRHWATRLDCEPGHPAFEAGNVSHLEEAWVKYHILVVDDDLYSRELITKLLVADGYEVSAATNGEEALGRLATRKPDLILMDLSLPVLDGWEVVRRIKQGGSRLSIPVIALTAHAMNGDRQRAIAAGCDEYVPKPLDYALLRAKIDAMLASQ